MVKYLSSYYKDLEREVAALAAQLSRQLSEDERKWIGEWISVGEYGLAVTAMMENLQKKAHKAPAGIVERVRELALRMGLDDDVNQYLPES